MTAKEQKIKFNIIQLNLYRTDAVIDGERIRDLPDALKRTLQCLFYDVTGTKEYSTGMITEAALDKKQKNKNWSPSKEHHYGCTRFVREWMEKSLDRDEVITEEEIRESIKEKLTWNLTTNKENNILRHNGQDYSDSRISSLVVKPEKYVYVR